MIGDFTKDQYGKIANQPSLFQPSQEIQDITLKAKEEYTKGNEILTRSWPELNDMSVIDRANRDKKTFNAFVDEGTDDPSEAWKWRGTRSMARNRALAMFAHLTSGFMFPMVSAQDQNNDEDRGVGDFMRDLILWMGDNSNYRSSFLQVVIGMLTSPVTYLGAEFVEVMQKIREKTEQGISIKEVLDQELSGFRAPVYGVSDVLITNAYVQNIQQQPCVIKQRYLDYSDAEKIYGKNDNWQFVQKGINSVFDEQTNLFYDVQDPDNSDCVKETIFMWRSEDLEIPFLGGIYVGADKVDHNPIKHRDNFNQPKYNVVPFGYYRISEHFFFYKSLMDSLAWDDQLIDAMYENVMNREFLDLMPPVIVTGEDKIDTSVVFPGGQFASPNENAKITPFLPQSGANKYGALEYIENSLKEGSISDTQMGQLPEASQKAFSVAKADQAAKTILKGVGQSLGESIVQYGKLMVDIAIRHLSIPEVEEIAGGAKRVKYRQFVLPSISNGKNETKIMKFSDELIGKEMTKDELDNANIKLFMEAGGKKGKKSISIVNPELASKMKYLIRIDPETMFSENKEYTQQLLGQMYTLLRADPLINAETLVRKMMYSFFRSEGDELMANPGDIENMMNNMKMNQEQPEGGVPLSKPPAEKIRSLAGVA